MLLVILLVLTEIVNKKWRVTYHVKHKGIHIIKITILHLRAFIVYLFSQRMLFYKSLYESWIYHTECENMEQKPCLSINHCEKQFH